MIEVLAAGPLITLQDGGRPGFLSQGLAQGGAADRRALAEAAALVGPGAGIEIPGAPLTVRFGAEAQLALTGAPMAASLDGAPLVWHASHPVPAGGVLELRSTGGGGVYSYLHIRGGFVGSEVMGSAAAHLIAGIGMPLQPGDCLEQGPGSPQPSKRLSTAPNRFAGGLLRCVATPQTALFAASEIARFEATAFTRDARGNRQGVRLAMEAAGFATDGQLSLLSDFILPGDVQMTGDGVPYILGPECQTTGGYPRIAHVIAADLPRALQAPVGAPVSFRFVSLAEARAARPGTPATEPLVRDPREMGNLGEFELISGVIDARNTEEEEARR